MADVTNLKIKMAVSLFLVTFVAVVASGKIIYVDADANGLNDGSSWLNTYKYLQDALMMDTDGDELRVAQGIYKPDDFALSDRPNLGRSETFQLKNGVTLKGGYAGLGQPDPNRRDVGKHETILSGDLNGDDGPADFNNIQAAINDANNGDTIIVADGRYTGYGNRDIDFDGKAITLRSENGPENCIIDCQHSGGGLYFHSGEDKNSVLEGFAIVNGSGGGGGAMTVHHSSPLLINCKFINNAGGGGGAIWVYGSSSIILINCTFSGNSIRGEGGGGIYNDGNGEDSRPTLIGCTFSGNWAEYGGGAMYNTLTNVTVVNCTFSRNWTNVGGGIENQSGNLTLTNCAFSGNYATWWGGGLHSVRSNLILTNCTFSGNAAPHGNAIACCWDWGWYPSNIELANCILWDGGNEICNTDGSTITITYSNVQGGWPGEGNISADPCFVMPGYWDSNGVWVKGDYHLLPDSPCIDAGTDAGVYTDIEGNVRPFDYPGVDNNSELPEFDMGAYETIIGIKVPTKFTPQALNCNSKGKWVKAHFVLPEEFAVEDVDANTPAKIESLGIKSDHLNVFINEDGLVEIEAAFERAAFCDVAGCGSIEMTVVGLLTNGQYFYGTDTIKIIKNSVECLAILSSHWLQTNCGKPDWCNGFDADRDTTVNLKDFALMASHWLEDYSD
jgi:hypothetical protein